MWHFFLARMVCEPSLTSKVPGYIPRYDGFNGRAGREPRMSPFLTYPILPFSRDLTSLTWSSAGQTTLHLQELLAALQQLSRPQQANKGDAGYFR